MIVYTEQGFNLRTFRGPLDRKRGTYSSQTDPTEIEIASAQSRLYDELIHTDQVLWCSLERLAPDPRHEARYVHTIEVDDCDVVTFLNGFVWENIIHKNRFVPPQERERMRHACCRDDPETRKKRITQLEDEYIKTHLPDDLWSNVIEKTISCLLSTVLLNWPLRHSRITGVEEIVERTN